MASQPRLALVIGNSNYENAPLANPVRDAALMADTLREVGFEVLEYTDLDRRDLTKAFINLGDRLEENGGNATTLVYYAGHGAQVNGENYLIPIGAQIEEEIDVEIEGVRASSLLGILRKARSSLNIVILDACRNNPFESSSRSAQTGLAKMDAPTGTLLAYSTAPGKVAEDGDGKNSTYTRALARAIKTPGAKVEEVFKTVRVNVVDRTQGRQVPWESSSLTGDFVFQEKLPEPEPEPVVTASIQQTNQVVEIEYWKSIANSTDPALFEAYIAEYPNGLFRSIAEQRVASLNTAIAAPEPDDGFEREKAVWNTVKDSANIGMLKGFIASFPDGVYATIANSMIADLEAKQQVASRTVEPVDDELVIWESVQNGTTVAEFQVYLDAYPDGRYAELARTKIAALNTTRSKPSDPRYPFDGAWRLSGKPVSFRRAYRYGVCRNGDSIDDTFVVERGKVMASVTSESDNQLNLQGSFEHTGRLDIDFSTGDGGALGGKGQHSGTYNMDSSEILFSLKIESGNQAGCRYELKMTRVN
ncbi:MAG: caspase family protein [Alphaproteobacteria bacterium]